MLLGKEVLPDVHVESWERLNEAALPARDAFFSHINHEPCNEADYARANEVWMASTGTTLQQYLELYLKKGMLLLADVLEELSGVCMLNYGLDSAHYGSSPQLSWDAMLRNTNCTIARVTDPQMISMVDVGIPGAVSVISTRHAQANNPSMTAFEPARPR